jgi:hypothetical protein
VKPGGFQEHLFTDVGMPGRQLAQPRVIFDTRDLRLQTGQVRAQSLHLGFRLPKSLRVFFRIISIARYRELLLRLNNPLLERRDLLPFGFVILNQGID